MGWHGNQDIVGAEGCSHVFQERIQEVLNDGNDIKGPADFEFVDQVYGNSYITKEGIAFIQMLLVMDIERRARQTGQRDLSLTNPAHVDCGFE